MEEPQNETQEEEPMGSVRRWIGENLRIIVSILFIVIALATSIYSYSQRTKESAIVFEDGTETQEQILIDGKEDMKTDSLKSAETAPPAKEDEKTRTAQKTEPEILSTETSKETTDAFISVANKGDGLTHLARKALANYLAKNPDSQLTVAHKIYIEDALRKSVGHKGGVHPGTEVSFSKDLIQKTIDQSKNLNERQLKNLQKYVPLVPSLS